MKKKKTIQGLQKYICVPDAYLKGCSDQLFAMVAEDGAHALKYGIVKGMTLIFDREKAFRKGCLSCFMLEDGPEQEYKLFVYCVGLLRFLLKSQFISEEEFQRIVNISAAYFETEKIVI